MEREASQLPGGTTPRQQLSFPLLLSESEHSGVFLFSRLTTLGTFSLSGSELTGPRILSTWDVWESGWVLKREGNTRERHPVPSQPLEGSLRAPWPVPRACPNSELQSGFGEVLRALPTLLELRSKPPSQKANFFGNLMKTMQFFSPGKMYT